MKKVVISGATSMLGIALLNECIESGVEVLAVIRKNSKNIDRIPSHHKITICECNLEEILRLPQLQKGKYEVFFHFAWDTPSREDRDDVSLQYRNAGYTIEAVKAAKLLGCTAFVGAGSQAEYGIGSEVMSPETHVNPVSAYGIAKYAAGRFAALLCHELGIRYNWARIFSVYGPFDGATMIMSSINKLLKGEKPSFTPSEQKWDYLYTKDSALAFYLIGEKGKDGAVYCVGSGKTQPLSDFIYTIRDAINPALPVGIGDLPYSSDQVFFLCAGIESLRKDTGFVPQYSFQQGIEETIKWVRNRNDSGLV